MKVMFSEALEKRRYLIDKIGNDFNDDFNSCEFLLL